MHIIFRTDTSVTQSGWSLTFRCVPFYCAQLNSKQIECQPPSTIESATRLEMEFGRHLAETINKEFESIRQFPDPVLWQIQKKSSAIT